ncbi:Type IV secretory pathway ATPase VirB11/Archaellum biosynthesis ATPase [Halopelagius inordinatus]|uniref:Type IV secretory pathway ATPase VirB11/Archaellum biosynthesis ATPase n=1 Tax=Halopelagius inordinatus TaxID=553467 RepID=A0A1I2MDS1_9EURY|nr:type II/IV secretion system ATPase subunit [Halopelagius inordinatus]SFF89592.1 Type IV secretory pathway ATPase VirB11/Archaellum biosynthesis ATPase [Halopelagius inordinatus]
MSRGPTLSIGESGADDTGGRVPAPVPPSDGDAWYAPDVRAQYEVAPGVVTTVRDDEDGVGFVYDVREPGLGPREEAALSSIRSHFSVVNRRRPLTREGTAERAAGGVPPKYRRVFDRLLDASPAARRRVEYYALRELRLLGEVTPLALDDRIEVVDVGDEDGSGSLVVHTTNYAPAVTEYRADAEFADRVAGERVRHYTVPFCGFDVDVVIHREHLLGDDRFTTKYAVLEPDLLPGDEELIDECKERIWEANVDEVVEDRREFVAERARQFLSRQLTARNTRAWMEATEYRVRTALAEYGLAVPPVDRRFAEDRLDDLVYYVLRDYVGEGVLTVPIRDGHLEDVEANRVGERVKVIPRAGIGDGNRVPTNLAFEDETSFVNVVTQLAASDGVELNASQPSAKVNYRPEGRGGPDGAGAGVEDDGETIRCAVALPVISEGGPHVSIRKQSAEPMTPVDLVGLDSLPTELVALLWMLYEHHGVVLFSGPTGVGKTTLMNAHMPFVPFDHRPVSIDEGSREVHLPHETGISLTTRDHENEFKRVSMADLMTEANYLNPDVEVIAEVNTPESFETFAEVLNTGHGVIGTTHAEDIETLVNRVVEQGLPTYLLEELDVVVFPRRIDGDRYVGEVVELVDEEGYDDLPATARTGTIEKNGRTLRWNTVLRRETDGTFSMQYDHPRMGDDHRRLGHRVFHRLAAATDRDVESVEAEFHRKHGYVQYLVKEGVAEFDRLFAFLSDLRTDEAATVERVRRQMTERTAEDGGARD